MALTLTYASGLLTLLLIEVSARLVKRTPAPEYRRSDEIPLEFSKARCVAAVT